MCNMVHCAGCEGPILDRFLLNVLDRAWHAKCVQCCECKCILTEKCFSREDRLYCRNDFFRRYGTKCGGCAQGILPNDLVRKARNKVFHLNCFTCIICSKQLSTGEELYVLEDYKFMCKDDYMSSSIGKDTTPLSVTSDPSLSPDCQDPQDDGSFSDKETWINDNEEHIMTTKRRGPRTTIKAMQLETLKAAFAAAPKPTRHIREQLAQETGLNMRVIQVWFQNRRSKERRMKQLSALTTRRHVFFRSPRRMRTLMDRLESGELASTYFTGDYQVEYNAPGVNYDYFPQALPSSQAQTPGELDYVSSLGPADTPLGTTDHRHHHHPADLGGGAGSINHQSGGEVACFTDIISHQKDSPQDSPSPDASGPGSTQSISSDMCGPSKPLTSLNTGRGYNNQLSHISSEMGEGTVW